MAALRVGERRPTAPRTHCPTSRFLDLPVATCMNGLAHLIRQGPAKVLECGLTRRKDAPQGKDHARSPTWTDVPHITKSGAESLRGSQESQSGSRCRFSNGQVGLFHEPYHRCSASRRLLRRISGGRGAPSGSHQQMVTCHWRHRQS